MPGTPRKSPPRSKSAGAGRIELSDQWQSPAQEPAQIALFGHPYDVRRDFTGSEVLEFGRMLQYQPDPEGPDDYTEHMVQRFAFVLSDGDAAQLWADIAAQNIGVAGDLAKQIYSLAGLMDEEGNFKAL